MDLCPDSALNLLKGIHDPEKLWGESQATYALLMTQAMDKNYMKFEFGFVDCISSELLYNNSDLPNNVCKGSILSWKSYA